MGMVLRGVFIYVLLMVLFRLAGKRTLSQITTFDLVLLLIISEAAQQGMIDNDNSLTGATILIVTLIGLDVLFSWLTLRWPWVDRFTDDVPVLLVENGRLLTDRLRRTRVQESDIMAAARCAHGLERFGQIKYAILERSGEISIIPRD